MTAIRIVLHAILSQGRVDVEVHRHIPLTIGVRLDDPVLTMQALKQGQRDWLRERAECWKASIGLEVCVANAYAFRIHALREGYSDARSDDANGASLGPVAYRCDGLDALLGAVFVNTREPVVSLSWLSYGIVLPRVESGSGAKYASDLWDSSPALFWTQGDTATFAPPGGTEVQCRREPIG